MANHASAKKRVRRNATRASINKARLSRIRTSLKKVDVSISEGNRKSAEDALRSAQSEMYRGVAKGILKKNTVARKMSRISDRIKKLK